MGNNEALESRLPTEKGFFPPAEGLKEFSYYKVEISFSKGNPIQPAVLHAGFLESNGSLGSFSWIRGSSWYSIEKGLGRKFTEEFYYCRVLEFLFPSI